jgi:hypothetical protein
MLFGGASCFVSGRRTITSTSLLGSATSLDLISYRKSFSARITIQLTVHWCRYTLAGAIVVNIDNMVASDRTVSIISMLQVIHNCLSFQLVGEQYFLLSLTTFRACGSQHPPTLRIVFPPVPARALGLHCVGPSGTSEVGKSAIVERRHSQFLAYGRADGCRIASCCNPSDLSCLANAIGPTGLSAL